MGAVASVVGRSVKRSAVVVAEDKAGSDACASVHHPVGSKQPRISNVTLSTQSSHSTPNLSQHRLSNSMLASLNNNQALGQGCSSHKTIARTVPPPECAAAATIDMYALRVPIYERHPFQDYTFGKKLGEGSFSSVYQGKSLRSGESVAIKEIDTKRLNKQQLLDVHMEMNVLSQIAHENVVTLNCVYSSGQKRYLVLELLRGGDLLTAVCRREFYAESDARRVMRQIVSALCYLHSCGVIHRDIKPENLILQDNSLDSPVKLVDFGFATLESLERSRDRERRRYLCGTPGYMPPEVLKDRKYSTKGDCWSLGVLLYILLSGLMPFSTDVDGEVHIRNGEFFFPDVRFATVSSAAKDLICKLLVVDEDERLTAAEVLRHRWMTLPVLSAPPNSAECSANENSCSSAFCDSTECLDHFIDNDISANLESLREHNAKRRFFGISSLLASLSPSHSSRSKQYVSNRRRSEPVLVGDNQSVQLQQLAQLNASINEHNSQLITNQNSDDSQEVHPSDEQQQQQQQPMEAANVSAVVQSLRHRQRRHSSV